MSQAEHVRYWLETATRDWNTAQILLARVRRPAPVFAHWTLEKLSKALWLQQQPTETMPPATDDVALLFAATSFKLTSAQAAFTKRLKAYQDDILEPNPEQLVYQSVAGETIETLVTDANKLREQLLRAIQIPI